MSSATCVLPNTDSDIHFAYPLLRRQSSLFSTVQLWQDRTRPLITYTPPNSITKPACHDTHEA